MIAFEEVHPRAHLCSSWTWQSAVGKTRMVMGVSPAICLRVTHDLACSSWDGRALPHQFGVPKYIARSLAVISQSRKHTINSFHALRPHFLNASRKIYSSSLRHLLWRQQLLKRPLCSLHVIVCFRDQRTHEKSFLKALLKIQCLKHEL